jgi:SAM-dependent methyltransferase
MAKKDKKRRHSKSTTAAVRKPRMADSADRHLLYEQSVQATDAEFDFVDATFRSLRQRTAFLIREDFCGTANMCVEWVSRRKRNHAIGVDLDGEVLAWAKQHNLAKLSPAARRRVTLLQDDVLTVRATPVDIVLAMNFSYQIFKDRHSLRGYFQGVRESLVEDGVLFIDAFGGYDAYREMRERTKHDSFTYIWDQARYNPINGAILCHIHFAFPDGSRLKRAFTYDWRLWTLPELQELLHEAGFSQVTVYWQGTDEETGEGNGIFDPATEGDADPGWISYLTAQK